MLLRTVLPFAFAAAALISVGCSGGGTASGLAVPSCDNSGGQQAFCVVQCNLGCGASGCTVTEIAQNQPVTFEFNRQVDPASVNFSTIQIKTPTGEEPVGQFLVSGNKVTFAPEIQVVGNSSFFGFKNGATYTLLIRRAGPGVATVRSLSGDALTQDVLCNLRVSRGIVDLDQQPPRASLVVPAAITGVSRNTTIAIEFSEIVDSAPFQATAVRDQPVQFRVRSAVTRNGVLECDLAAAPVSLSGTLRLQQDTARQRTVLTFTPSGKLPSEGCVQVEVTSRVRDVAGTPARGQLFQFLIERTPLERKTINEGFSAPIQFDADRSAARWGSNMLVPTEVGGSGRHGEFDITVGQSVGQDEYLWDLDRDTMGSRRGFIVPARLTLTGQDEFVEDGVFEFTKLLIPAGTTLRIRGSKPMRILVRGKCEIFGRIDAAGVTATDSYPGKRVVREDFPGQAASPGGPGGGAGGAGGDLLMNMGLPGNGWQPVHDGRDGGNVSVAASHSYAGRVAETGGKGSHQWPFSGLDEDVNFGYFNTLCTQTPAPGSGGGFQGGGDIGDNTSTVGEPSERQPDVDGGRAFNLTTDRQGRTSLIHYVVGGSGGGGGGCNTFYVHRTQNRFYWIAGGAGGGGGGALAIRVGGDLVTGPNSLIDVSGGGGSTGGNISNGPATVGGGGSGGTALLQTGGDYLLQGTLRAVGGPGGRFFSTLGGLGQYGEMRGGNGANGFYRIEAPVPPGLNQIGLTLPPATAANVGTLDDRDLFAGAQSAWYLLEDPFPPQWAYYEVEADVGTERVVFSDDPSRSSRAATPFIEPVGFLVQGAKIVDGVLQPPTAPWRAFVGPHDSGQGNLNRDAATAFRFQVIFNRSVVNDVVVRRVTVAYDS